MNIDYLRDIDYSNAVLLPNAMRKELENGGYGFTVELDGTYYSLNVFNNLNADISSASDEAKLKLYTDFNKNLSLTTDQYVTGFWDGYRDRKFLEGYPEEKNKKFQIFFGVYNKGYRIHNPNILSFKKNAHVYNNLKFLQKHMYNYGYEVGCFIRNWTIILNNINLFESIFNKYCHVENYNHENQEQNKTKPLEIVDFAKIKDIIKPLSGYWNKKIILDENDFLRFTNYIFFIIENHCLPNDTLPFKNTPTSIEFIRKTIHLVYIEIGKKDKEVYVLLIHLFKQLENTALETTKCKFSAYASNYENDLKNMITYH
ncbi:MAG TPA: hypothetical protein VIV55_03715 [Flavobacterium sp.]